MTELITIKVQIIGYLAIEMLAFEEASREQGIYNLNHSTVPCAVEYRKRKADINKIFEEIKKIYQEYEAENRNT